MGWRHRKNSVRITPLDIGRAGGYSFFAKWFVRFYSLGPWNEAWVCPGCKPTDDFGPAHRYPLDSELTSCSACGTPFEQFWSPDRTRRYIESAMSRAGFRGRVARVERHTVGWIWGYEVSPRDVAVQEHLLPTDFETGFYIDRIATLPGYRRPGGLRGMCHQLLFLAKMRLSPDRASVLDFLLDRSQPPVVARLFLAVLKDLDPPSLPYLVTRTHRKAHHVIRLIRLAGFDPVGPSLADPERHYFMRRLA